MKILKTLLIATIILFIVFVIYESAFKTKKKQACFKDRCFDIEMADTIQKQKQGLMFRKKLAEDKGMLFVFDRDEIYPFWMKNTLIPLDIIWLNRNKQVVFIKNNAQPCAAEICQNIMPDEKANYVLEINAGLAEKMNIKLGDEVNIKY